MNWELAGLGGQDGIWRSDSREGKMYDVTERGDDDARERGDDNARARPWGQAQAEWLAFPRSMENSFTRAGGKARGVAQARKCGGGLFS